ncbi:hypothetical protein [Streptosporangium sp. KLBMP 9127]
MTDVDPRFEAPDRCRATAAGRLGDVEGIVREADRATADPMNT